jgi:co-chaperonin GroES (HSP10)
MQTFRFLPVGEWLLVERAQKPEEKIIATGALGDLVAPTTSITAIPKATILAIGDKVPSDYYKVGDEIVLNSYSGEDIQFGDTKLTVVRWDECKLRIQYLEEGVDAANA